MTSQALINPDILRWARERAGLDRTGLAKKVASKAEKVAQWEDGSARPTFNQAQTLAKKLNIPFGYFYRPDRPREDLPLPDLRTIGDETPGEPSPELLDTLADIFHKRDWYLEYLRQIGAEPLPFIGRFDQSVPPETVARDMAAELGINERMRREADDWETFMRQMVRQVEGSGIWFMRNGVVGSNTHRPLKVEEFRGFAISDPLAPLIFINGKDADPAQLFTIAHELAHLWLGESGLSNISLRTNQHQKNRRIEKYCNRVAAELLVPGKSFKKNWIRHQGLEENIDGLKNRYRVSALVLARRAFDLGLVEWSTYLPFYQDQVEQWRRKKTKNGKQKSGGDYYRTHRLRSGTHFSRAVLASMLEGRLLHRDAASLLGLKVPQLKKYAETIGTGSMS